MPSLAAEVYVLVPPPKSVSFATDLASVVRKHGMPPNVGRATDDKGEVLTVLDAESDGLRFRSQNVLLSGMKTRRSVAFTWSRTLIPVNTSSQ